MSFYLYYIYHAILAVGVAAIFFYLLKKITIKSNARIKLISLVVLLILSNFSFFKYGIGILNINLANYRYQNCDGRCCILNTQFEHKMDTKEDLINYYRIWKEDYHIVDDTVLYRTFDFKWWMFWEYYTYYSTDIYELPLLPKECKKKY